MVTIRNRKYAGSGASLNRHPSRMAVVQRLGRASNLASDRITVPGYVLTVFPS